MLHSVFVIIFVLQTLSWCQKWDIAEIAEDAPAEEPVPAPVPATTPAPTLETVQE